MLLGRLVFEINGKNQKMGPVVILKIIGVIKQAYLIDTSYKFFLKSKASLDWRSFSMSNDTDRSPVKT